MFAKTWEGDVRYRTRFLISKHIFEGIETASFPLASEADIAPIQIPSNLRITYFDIETKSPIVPRWKDPRYPITIATFYDNYEEIYYTFAWHPNFRRKTLNETYHRRIKTYGDTAPWKIFIGSNEQEMLEALAEYIRDRDPDLMTGWNIQVFDFPYLKARSEHLGVNFDQISPLNRVTILEEDDKQKTFVKVWGRVVLDELDAYKNMKVHELESYRLDRVSEAEFGDIGTIHPKKKSMGDLWFDDFKRCLVLNALHVELCVEIDRKRRIFNFFDYERRFTGCEFDDIFARSRVVDATFLREALDLGIVLPSKNYGIKHKKFPGGKVFPSTPGKYRNVIVSDFSAFFPSLLIALNASKEFRIEDKELIEKLEEIHQFYFLLPVFAAMIGEVPRFPKFPYTRAENGTWFYDHEDSLARRVISKFIDRRNHFKKLMWEHLPVGKCPNCNTAYECNELWSIYNDIQKSYKSRINTYYGVSGYKGFRLYDRPTAWGITSTAGVFLIFTRDFIQSDYLYGLIKAKFPTYPITERVRVIYGDTDSTFLKLPSALSYEQAIEVAEFIVKRVNLVYRRLLSRYHIRQEKFRIKMGIERLFDPLIFVEKKSEKKGAKKRYAGRERWADGRWTDKFYKKGFESVRSDTPKVSKGAQDRCLTLLCYDVPVEVVMEGVRTIVDRIEKGKYSIEGIALRTGVRVDVEKYALGQKSLPIHVRAVLTSRKYWNLDIVDDKILYCHFKRGDIRWDNGQKKMRIAPGRTDVFAFVYEHEVPPEFREKIDIDLMIKKTVQSDLEQILMVEGVHWEQFFHNQRTLDAYV